MSNQIHVPTSQQESQNNNAISSDLTGKIAESIGTGKNAKDSFIWMTITWSFAIALVLSTLLFFRSFCQIANGENLIDAITSVWSVFIPIITLALGYAFGRGE